MNAIKYFIREHHLIIILGFLLTLVISAPVIVFPFITKDTYRGINIVPFGTDSHFYLSRAKEALEGNSLGSPFLREGKSEQDTFFMYNERVLAAPLRLLGLADSVNIVTVYNIYNFIGVFVLILLIYFFVFQLSRNKLLAVTAAIFAIGGYHIVYRQFLYTDLNIYGRPMFPYVSSLAFFLYLNLLTLWFKTRRRLYKLAAALAFGALFYVYIFAWTFALALNGALFLLFLLKRESALVKALMFITGLGILLGAYNLVQMFILFHSDIGAQISYFHWSVSARSSVFSKIGAAMLAVFAFFSYKKRNDSNRIFILALILAGWIALNQQIITGRVVEIGHYYWYFIVPLSIIVGLYMIWMLLEAYSVWRVALFASTIAIVFAHSVVGQYLSFFPSLPERIYEQRYQPIIAALQQDVVPRVILAADDISLAYLFTIYTHHDLFWGSPAVVIPFRRFTDALYVYLYLNKDARGNVADYLRKMTGDATDNSFYKRIYRHVEGFSSGLNYYDYAYKAVNNDNIIGPHREQLITKFSKEYAGINVNDLLLKYGVTYIVWDKNRNPEWDVLFIPNLQEVVSYNNIYLYKINEKIL